jgi:hypothetical protein
MVQQKGLVLFLVAVILALAAFIVVSGTARMQPAYAAGGGGAANNIIALMGNYNSGAKEVLYIVDTKRGTIAVYDYTEKALNLKSVRHYAKDIQMLEYPPGRQRPSVKEINDQIKKASKKKSGGR